MNCTLIYHDVKFKIHQVTPLSWWFSIAMSVREEGMLNIELTCWRLNQFKEKGEQKYFHLSRQHSF